MMRAQLRPALVSLLILTILTGVAYPLVITGLAQVLFPDRANGSLIAAHGKVVGSSLIGQPFDSPGFFWGRLSATAPFSYNAAASSGSNLGPTNPALLTAVLARVAGLTATAPGEPRPVPVDLVTASGSGLDPHISPAAAGYQARRVARARGMEEAKVRELIAAATHPRQFGLLGEPTVNVLELNLALERLRSEPSAPGPVR